MTEPVRERVEETVEVQTTGPQTAPGFTPATPSQKLWLSVALIAFTGLAVMACAAALNRLEALNAAPVSVRWKKSPTQQLASGPATFYYDEARGELQHRGAINEEGKKVL